MKKNRIPVLVILGLTVSIGFLSLLNRENLAEKRNLSDQAIFTVWSENQVLKSYTMDEIKILGEKEFTADLKASGKEPVTHIYTGVPLLYVLEDAGLDVGQEKTLTVSAIDGYVVAITYEKWKDPENVYLAYKMDGNPLGSKADGGLGPYQIIISKDKFSQFWCKYAYKAEILE